MSKFVDYVNRCELFITDIFRLTLYHHGCVWYNSMGRTLFSKKHLAVSNKNNYVFNKFISFKSYVFRYEVLILQRAPHKTALHTTLCQNIPFVYCIRKSRLQIFDFDIKYIVPYQPNAVYSQMLFTAFGQFEHHNQEGYFGS